MFKILVPVDGTNHSLKALHIACDLASKYQAVIVLLHVLTETKTAQEILELAVAGKFDPDLKKQLQMTAIKNASKPLNRILLEIIGDEILKLAAGRAQRLDIKTELLALASGHPAESILLAHKLIGASTIVMGTRGVRGSTLAQASVSHAVFAKAECTCIAVK